jgi:hypothetical protein
VLLVCFNVLLAQYLRRGLADVPSIDVFSFDELCFEIVREAEPRAGAIETEELRAALLAGLPDDPHEVDDADRPRWLLAQLLLYHRREEKPVWWAFFDRIGRTGEELHERDSDAIGGLERAGPPIGSGESLVWPFRSPAAASSRAGSQVFDPATAGPAGKIETLDEGPEHSRCDAA